MRLTECFSMYSLMSMRMMACSSSNMNSASALASSVLPTPVGPRNRNEPIGRFGSCSPARARRTASDTATQGFLLADHALAQCVFHGEQLLALALQHLLDRHAGPAGDDRGDLFGVDHFRRHGVLRRPWPRPRPGAFRARDLAVGDLGGALQVATALGGHQLGAQPVERLARLGG